MSDKLFVNVNREESVTSFTTNGTDDMEDNTGIVYEHCNTQNGVLRCYKAGILDHTSPLLLCQSARMLIIITVTLRAAKSDPSSTEQCWLFPCEQHNSDALSTEQC